MNNQTKSTIDRLDLAGVRLAIRLAETNLPATRLTARGVKLNNQNEILATLALLALIACFAFYLVVF